MNKKSIHRLACIMALTLLALPAFFTTGCASTGDSDRSITKQDVITALEITAALTIGDDLRKADTALRIVSDARRFIREGERLTAGGALSYIAEQALRSTNLTTAQQIAIRSFVQRFRGNFAIETESVGINPEIVITVNEALDAIEEVSREILDNGVASPRSYAGAPAAPASAATEPIDFSLYGWLTSPETRAATREDGSVDHDVYRRYAY